MDTETKPDPVRQLIVDKLAEHRLTMSDVSKNLGKNHAYLHQFLNRGIPAHLPESIREQLAAILQVPEPQLKGSGAARVGSLLTGRARVSALLTGDRIPVMAIGQAGADGWFSWPGATVDFVSRPPYLANATQAYAVYVVGPNMEPRYMEGEIAHIHPDKPVTLGACVLVRLRPDREGDPSRASIRRLVRRSASKVTLEQFNPAKETDIKLSEIVAMHRIVGSAETSGT